MTRIVLPCLLVNIRVCLHIGNQHLLHPVEDEESLHHDQLGHNVEGYPACQGQKENFCLIHKTHHKARGGGVDGDGGVHYLLGFP